MNALLPATLAIIRYRKPSPAKRQYRRQRSHDCLVTRSAREAGGKCELVDRRRDMLGISLDAAALAPWRIDSQPLSAPGNSSISLASAHHPAARSPSRGDGKREDELRAHRKLSHQKISPAIKRQNRSKMGMARQPKPHLTPGKMLSMRQNNHPRARSPRRPALRILSGGSELDSIAITTTSALVNSKQQVNRLHRACAFKGSVAARAGGEPWRGVAGVAGGIKRRHRRLTGGAVCAQNRIVNCCAAKWAATSQPLSCQ